MSEESRRRARLRWITLGEAVAIAAVLVSALGLWNSYEDHREARTEKAASAHHAPLALRAAPNGDGSVLTLTAVASDDVIQSQAIRFVPAFKLATASTTSDARIEADWFGEALKADRKTRALADETTGDERMPVMIETAYLADGRPTRARAFYDVGYVLKGRFLRGAAVRLRGLSLIGTAPAADTAVDARLSALWAARAGKIKG